jgi:hypothetical protein
MRSIEWGLGHLIVRLKWPWNERVSLDLVKGFRKARAKFRCSQGGPKEEVVAIISCHYLEVEVSCYRLVSLTCVANVSSCSF